VCERGTQTLCTLKKAGCDAEGEDAPSLGVFKARLDEALSNLVWWKVSLPMAGDLEPDGL